MRKRLSFAAPLVAILLAGSAIPALSGPLSLIKFQDKTGLKASDREVSAVWNSLVSMGTTEFLGGNLGSMRLDESAMIAGASTVGASEFDNFLRTGNLSQGSGMGGILAERMTAGAGHDLSHITGSYTAGGGAHQGASFASLTSLGGASTQSGSCDPEISEKLVEVGETHVNGMVSAAMSKEYGFSQVKDLRSSTGGGSGFAAMGCLDKLFQGTGVDILFKPPSLGNLSGLLQNWSCGDAVGVSQQIAGAFGSGEIYKTSSLGGFYPALTMGEAMDGAKSKRPGIGQSGRDTFGFEPLQTVSASQMNTKASLSSLYR